MNRTNSSLIIALILISLSHELIDAQSYPTDLFGWWHKPTRDEVELWLKEWRPPQRYLNRIPYSIPDTGYPFNGFIFDFNGVINIDESHQFDFSSSIPPGGGTGTISYRAYCINDFPQQYPDNYCSRCEGRLSIFGWSVLSMLPCQCDYYTCKLLSGDFPSYHITWKDCWGLAGIQRKLYDFNYVISYKYYHHYPNSIQHPNNTLYRRPPTKVMYFTPQPTIMLGGWVNTNLETGEVGNLSFLVLTKPYGPEYLVNTSFSFNNQSVLEYSFTPVLSNGIFTWYQFDLKDINPSIQGNFLIEVQTWNNLNKGSFTWPYLTVN